MLILINLMQFSLYFHFHPGQDGGGRFIRRFGRWHKIAKITRNYIGREAWQAKQRSYARP